MQNIIKINKSELKKLSFKDVEALNNKKQRELERHLAAAIQKDKDGTGKVEISFQTEKRGLFKVISPILTAGEEFLILKGGESIPLNSITKISL